jgi:surfeit locus 1 family protein
MFVPENKPEEGEWHFLDVEAMAKSMRLPADTPLVEVITSETDAKQSPGKSSHTAMEVLGGRRTLQSIQAEKDMETFPLAKSEGDFRQFSVMPQDHLNYALTWFSLSAATTGLAFKVIRSALKKSS